MLEKNKLKPADILLFRTTPRSTESEKFIAWAQHVIYNAPVDAKFCHVALVDYDTDLMCEAVWPKTKISEIDFAVQGQPEKIEVYRVRNITDAQVQATIQWAHDHLDEWYDVPLFLTGWLDAKHAEVCSTYVSHGFQASGLDVPHGSNAKKLILPDDYYLDTVTTDRIM